MNVNKWGPGGWNFLHSITFNYPLNPTENDKKNYSNFFKSIGNMLPCKYCRESYIIYYKYLPIDEFLDSREGVTYWFYTIHSLVNQKIYKNNTTFSDVIKKYENFRASCGTISKNGDLNKKYRSCQNKIPELIDLDYLQKFIQKAKTYDNYINIRINELIKSPENPNKKLQKFKIKYN
jgi:hypothetical protein